MTDGTLLSRCANALWPSPSPDIDCGRLPPGQVSQIALRIAHVQSELFDWFSQICKPGDDMPPVEAGCDGYDYWLCVDDYTVWTIGTHEFEELTFEKVKAAYLEKLHERAPFFVELTKPTA